MGFQLDLALVPSMLSWAGLCPTQSQRDFCPGRWQWGSRPDTMVLLLYPTVRASVRFLFKIGAGSRRGSGLAWSGKVKGRSLCLPASCLSFSWLQLGWRFSTFYSRNKRKVKGWKFPSPERSERLSSGGSSWPGIRPVQPVAAASVLLPCHPPLPWRRNVEAKDLGVGKRVCGGVGFSALCRGWWCPLFLTLPQEHQRSW